MEHRTFSQFQVSYEATVEKIYTYVFYRTGRNRDLAEDLTSEIFLKALERYDSYDPHSSFNAWIFTIARNHVIDRYRTHREHVQIDQLANVLSAPHRDLSEELDERSRVERVLQTIERLPEQHREILSLRFVSELDTAEIAEVLGKQPGAIRVAIHRALRALKTLLARSTP